METWHRPRRPAHTKEAAAWLGISEKKLRELARRGVLGVRREGTWYFSWESLADYASVPLENEGRTEDGR